MPRYLKKVSSNYYCSQKWWWLTVDPERRLLASCCKASQQPIDTSWLKNNPGNIFNNPTIVQERQDMLDNKPVASCSKSCWIPESQGIPSRRTMLSAVSNREFTTTSATPEVVEIVLGSDCNMSCVYCSKRFSTAWLRDIEKNGPYIADYKVDDRFDITIDDKVIIKLGQATIKNSDRYKLVLDEVTKFENLRTLKIMGGEPFLYNGLEDILNLAKSDTIEITTGLGVNTNRFSRLVKLIPKEKTTLVISAESVGPLYEFVRNGNTYENFLRNIEVIKAHGINYKFAYTISNLNIHGFKEFQDTFATPNDYFNVLVDPVYLSPGLIDPESKERILNTKFIKHENEIHQAVSASYTNEQFQHFKQFLPEFARRRDLSLDIFPKSFLKWIRE